MRTLLLIFSFCFSLGLPAAAGEAAYDPKADAHAELTAALAAADERHPVLIVFGADWCPDCRALDRAMRASPTAALLAASFRVVKIDVGNFDHNMDIAERFGNPTKKGIPAAVLLSPKGEVRYATRSGELASARRMNEGGIHDFFRRLAANGHP